MEDVKAYIESGILELYVVGDLSQDEKLQVEEMALKHKTVKDEIGQIELSLEAYALTNALEPANQLRDKVLGSLLTNFADDRIFAKPIENSKPEPKGNVIQIKQGGATNFYKYAFAASLVALIASLVALFSLYGRLQDSDAQIASLQSHNQSFANQVNFRDKEISIFRDPSVKMIKLQGTAKAPSARMIVAWSVKQKEVMIDLENMKLAETDKDHQYQLWAMVNNKPVSLGVFDAKADTAGMKEMKPIADATLFAVTIEPRGGSINPHLDEMVVAGKINI